jgi:hypothetical protein
MLLKRNIISMPNISRLACLKDKRRNVYSKITQELRDFKSIYLA